MKYGGNQGYDFYTHRPMGGSMPGGRPMSGPGPMPGGAPGPGQSPGPMGGGPMPPGGGLMAGNNPGGSLRNNLGSGLKALGIFQKDGKINNSRGGLFGSGGKNMGVGPFGFLGNNGGEANQPRQLILESPQPGILANGMATISLDNVFTCMANLPAPSTLVGQGYGTYATYLFDDKRQSGFLAGILRPVGNGVYQTQFRSQVPLAYYSQVMITIENPQSLGHTPQGPVILQNKQPLAPVRFLKPIKKAGGSVWNKVNGFIKSRGKGAAISPGGGILEEGVGPGGSVAPLEPAGAVLDELGSVPSNTPPVQ